MSVILETRDLAKYFGGVRAVDGVSIRVRRGELLGIIGPNGAGKTTLFNLITGFLKPTRGKVIYEGREIQGMPPARIARMGIARTFQIVRPLKNLTVFDNVLTACGYREYAGLSFVKPWMKEEYMGKAEKLIREVGLEDYMYKPTGTLPLGYLRRLEIARALALDPKILLLDESMSGMSMEEITEIEAIIKDLWRKGLTVILVEHNVPVAVELSERMYVLNFGRIIAEGRPEEIISDKRVIEAYLGAGYAA
jgi:branched-chain amino acid transport system ATP-binding protein